MLAIGVHPYVTGAAHRIKYFEQLYDYINEHDGVVHWTGQQIYRLVRRAGAAAARVARMGARRPYVPSLEEATHPRCGARVTRIGRAEPQARRVSHEQS